MFSSTACHAPLALQSRRCAGKENNTSIFVTFAAAYRLPGQPVRQPGRPGATCPPPTTPPHPTPPPTSLCVPGLAYATSNTTHPAAFHAHCPALLLVLLTYPPPTSGTTYPHLPSAAARLLTFYQTGLGTVVKQFTHHTCTHSYLPHPTATTTLPHLHAPPTWHGTLSNGQLMLCMNVGHGTTYVGQNALSPRLFLSISSGTPTPMVFPVGDGVRCLHSV